MEEFSTHLGGSFELDISRETFANQIFSENPNFEIFVIETNNGLSGYASIIFQFSIWKGKSYIYLDDFYIQPAWRNKGIGLEIMTLIKIEAKTRGMDMIKWEVQIENQRGRIFYERLGAKYREAGLFKWEV